MAQHLRRNHAAIAAHELRAMGFSESAVLRLVERGVLARVYFGVYRAGGAPPSRENQLKCALLSVGADAVLTRQSAAHHQGFLDYAPPRPQIAVPRRIRTTRNGQLAIERISNLIPGDVTVRSGLSHTSPVRTMIELAGDAETPGGFKALKRAVRQATVADRQLPFRLSSAIEERGRFRGSQKLRLVLEEHTPDSVVTRSPLELDFVDLCRKYGLPIPATNVMLLGFEVDAAWFDAKVFVELDTFRYHGDARSFEADRARDAALVVAGYRGLRVTKARLRREERVVMEQVRALLAATIA